ncbi:MAG TPA: ATP-binding protein [Chitinophagaceae bacterium]|nr:ATP-binding protein [Chitinophagaceae bacterium]
MKSATKNRIKATGFISVLYVFLLCYTIAALVAWGIFLEHQNQQLARQQIIILGLRTDRIRQAGVYRAGLNHILNQEKGHTWQYFGEGGTFLIIILIGAGYVYGGVRKHIRLSQQQFNFMMAVTHELKSPIAVIQLNMETLSRHRLDEHTRTRLLENTILETSRLNHLCNNMLLASQLESRQFRIVKEEFDFTGLVDQCVRENNLRSNYHEFTADLQPELLISGDRLMLHLAVNNLLENAVKYSPRGSVITVQLRVREGQAILRVSDTGAGIPDSEKKKIFNRFYRIGNENTRTTRGTGLGLYLSRFIARQHGGTITVTDNNPKGSNFEIILPGAETGNLQI